jgi:hypothetical protein
MPHDGVMAKLPPVLDTDDLPLAELCAARLDGELFTIDGAWTPVDEPDLPAFRAAVVARRAPRALIIERLSAAWVHGALDAPPPLAQFCVPAHARVALVDAPGSVIREVRIDDADIVQLKGISCTSALRTAFDLLRDPSVAQETAIRVVAALLAANAGTATAVRTRLNLASRMPHKSMALARLDHAEGRVDAGYPGDLEGEAAQPSLTR